MFNMFLLIRIAIFNSEAIIWAVLFRDGLKESGYINSWLSVQILLVEVVGVTLSAQFTLKENMGIELP